MNSCILVVGAVLLDVIGESEESQRRLCNREGSVKLSVGGAAFNFAANFTAHGYNCALLTALKKGSPTSAVIRDALKTSRIDQKHIIDSENIAEPAYVAAFTKKILDVGITSTPIESVDIINKSNLRKAVVKSQLIVVDTNLSTRQIQGIAKLCKEYKRPIAVSIVSDAKVKRIANQEFDKKFDLVAMNNYELSAAGFDLEQRDVDSGLSEEICLAFNSNSVIVSTGVTGHFVFNLDGSYSECAPPYHNTIVNTLGAGDALFSAACIAIINNERLDSIESESRIKEWVSSVLNRHEANLVDLLSGDVSGRICGIWSLITVLCLLISTISMLAGTFIPNISPFWFGACLFTSCIFAGGAGSVVRQLLYDNVLTQNNYAPKSLALGMVAGLTSGLVSALPHLTADGIATNLRTDISGLNLLIILTFIISIAAGVASDSYLKGLEVNGQMDDHA